MSSARVITRLALLAAALVAAAWLVASLRASDLESRAQAVVDRVQQDPPQAELDRAIGDLRDARSFNADEMPLVNEALLLWQAGRMDQAAAVAERVVADEPRNVEGWFALFAILTAAGERERASHALARVRTLDPLRANVLEGFNPRAPAG
jgi:cytochrome c-type biogenesis protein CcmH/NrfG